MSVMGETFRRDLSNSPLPLSSSRSPDVTLLVRGFNIFFRDDSIR